MSIHMKDCISDQGLKEYLCYNGGNFIVRKGCLPMSEQYYAIIDIGSNTVRLVVYERSESGRFKEVENIKAVARLRNYLGDDYNLSEEGIENLLSILRSFKKVTDTYELEQLVCVATATIRQSLNQEMITKRVKDELNHDMRILSEEEEAYYGYLAVVNSTALREGITIDIGGGSTEVTYYKDKEIKHSHSFPFGALTLKQMFVKDDVPSPKEMENVKNYLVEQFKSLSWLTDRRVPIIGIGGSARNMAQVDQSLKSYPLAGLHQYRMFEHDMSFIKSYLLTLSFKKLQKVEGLTKDRADIILPAIEVFHSLYEVTDATSFILSRKGLRDGVFYEQLMEDFNITVFPDVLEESFNELAIDYNINYKHVHQVTHLAQIMFDELQEAEVSHLSREDLTLLKRGAFVFNLGEYIDSESSSQHTFYLLANRTIDGLMHKERLMLALVASYKSKPIFKQYFHPYKHWFLKEEKKKIRTLGALTKFAYSFDSTRRSIVEDLHVEVKGEDINIVAFCNQDPMAEEYQVEKQKKHLEKALKMRINITFTQKG